MGSRLSGEHCWLPDGDLDIGLTEYRQRLEGLTSRELLERLGFRQIRRASHEMPSVLMDERHRLLHASERMVERCGMVSRMQDIILHYLDDLESYAEVATYVPPLDFPVMITALAGRTELPASVGVALVFHYIGLHMLDDVHDEELPEGIEENEASTTAMACVTTIPGLALLEPNIPLPLALRHRLVAELHFYSHPIMTGQFLDISRSIDGDLDVARRVLEQRNGAFGRVFGRLPALAQGCAESEIDVLGDAVAAMSMSSQILDDIENLWNRPISSDALNHAKSLPLCFVLDQQPELRNYMYSLCDVPSVDSHRRLREGLEHHGALHFGITCIRQLRARALQDLLRFGDREEIGPVEAYLLDCVAPSPLSAAEESDLLTTHFSVDASLDAASDSSTALVL